MFIVEKIKDEKMKMERIKNFIQKSNEIFSNKYDYSLVEYKNNKTKVKIICTKHGIFEKTPNKHLSGQACQKCSLENSSKIQSSNTEDFVKKSTNIHRHKQDYSLITYKHHKTKVKIICSKPGIFEQTPNKHLRGCGCPKCADNIKLTKKEFIKRSRNVHNYKYNYSLVKYKNNRTKVKIICSEHGIFEQIPTNHLRGKGCDKCKINSIGEKTIENLLKEKNIIFTQQKTFDDCKNIFKLPFDFYIPKLNMCIEYDGRQHFNINTKFYTKSIKINDNIKNKYCKSKNIKLLRIKYIENIEKKLIKNL